MIPNPIKTVVILSDTLYPELAFYRWHWRAFLAGGGSAFWLFAYGVFYWASRLSLGSFSSVVLYMGYLLLLCLLDFLVTGRSSFLVNRDDSGQIVTNDHICIFRYHRIYCDVLGSTQTL